MEIKSSATVVLETPSGRSIQVRVSTATDVPPCPYCKGTAEAVLVLVEPDQSPEDECIVIIYPCGYGYLYDNLCCHAGEANKSKLQPGS